MADEHDSTAAFAEGTLVNDHDVVLNRLNGPTRFYWNPRERFEKNLAMWNGLPVIYAPHHPNAAEFMVDPDKAVAKVGGRQVGVTSGTYIDGTGGTKLRSILRVDDPEVEALIKDEDVSLGLSTTYRSPGGYKMRPDGLKEPIGDVEPGHVLVFVPRPGYIQGDDGAWVLNQVHEGDDNMADETVEKGKLAKILAILTGKGETAEMQEVTTEQVAEAADAVVEEVIDAYADWDTARFIKEISDLKALIAKLKAPAVEDVTTEEVVVAEVAATETTEVAEMQARIKVLEAERAEHLTAEADKQWAQMMAKLPPGLVHKDKEAEARKKWDDNPKSFALFAMEHHTDMPVPGKEGAEFMDTTGEQTTEEPKGTIGGYNAVESTWG